MFPVRGDNARYRALIFGTAMFFEKRGLIATLTFIAMSAPTKIDFEKKRTRSCRHSQKDALIEPHLYMYQNELTELRGEAFWLLTSKLSRRQTAQQFDGRLERRVGLTLRVHRNPGLETEQSRIRDRMGPPSARACPTYE